MSSFDIIIVHALVTIYSSNWIDVMSWNIETILQFRDSRNCCLGLKLGERLEWGEHQGFKSELLQECQSTILDCM